MDNMFLFLKNDGSSVRLAGSHFLEEPNQASTISYLTPPAENAGLYKACRFKSRRDARFSIWKMKQWIWTTTMVSSLEMIYFSGIYRDGVGMYPLVI